MSHPRAAAPLSVQLFSVRDALEADPDAALARLAETGFQHVEPYGLCRPDRTPAENLVAVRHLRAALDRAGLGVSAVHAGLPEDLGQLAEACAALEADTVFVPHPHMVTAASPFDEATFTSGDTTALDAFAARLGEAAAAADTHGLRLGYHNHWFEWAILPDGTTAWDRFWSRAGEHLAAEVDLYWVAAAGADPVAVLDHLAERTLSLHLKDGPAEPWQPQTPLGTGRVDVDAALGHAPDSVRWHVVEVDSTDLDPFELLAGNARALVRRGHSTWQG
ncbi:sugar phosphate isomerase/epimerase family protein [Streptomyces sp. NPDC059740]|uniref:sugar phosphate isomerase/epimerase family protein n=1 Tax=Streptomyces sp. NPDC059740 TaxID=3346926 RepID=UPI00364A1802